MSVPATLALRQDPQQPLHNTDAIYQDYDKSLDKVNHKILSQKVWPYAYGICGKVNSLVESFLILADGRYTYCKPRSLLHRQVPQGTVLGPILFRLLIYLNDTESCIFQFRSLISSFADVTRIIRAISITTRVKDILLQQNLVNCNVSQWLNKATLNNAEQR